MEITNLPTMTRAFIGMLENVFGIFRIGSKAVFRTNSRKLNGSAYQ